MRPVTPSVLALYQRLYFPLCLCSAGQIADNNTVEGLIDTSDESAYRSGSGLFGVLVKKKQP